jgi:hypothetical protein
MEHLGVQETPVNFPRSNDVRRPRIELNVL